MQAFLRYAWRSVLIALTVRCFKLNSAAPVLGSTGREAAAYLNDVGGKSRHTPSSCGNAHGEETAHQN
jgi:hypothetical protein